jgi:hypothetical protein
MFPGCAVIDYVKWTSDCGLEPAGLTTREHAFKSK